VVQKHIGLRGPELYVRACGTYAHAAKLQAAFLFIPINVAAFASVPHDKTNMGTGIINLARKYRGQRGDRYGHHHVAAALAGSPGAADSARLDSHRRLFEIPAQQQTPSCRMGRDRE
jgi:hypothetical protein